MIQPPLFLHCIAELSLLNLTDAAAKIPRKTRWNSEHPRRVNDEVDASRARQTYNGNDCLTTLRSFTMEDYDR